MYRCVKYIFNCLYINNLYKQLNIYFVYKLYVKYIL